jgi:hypothetical protein
MLSGFAYLLGSNIQPEIQARSPHATAGTQHQCGGAGPCGLWQDQPWCDSSKPEDRVVAVHVRSFDSSTVLAVAAMSSVLSTAALDKHPQSKERGITLDLGFSSFSVRCSDMRLA